MPAATADLFLLEILEDLEGASRTNQLTGPLAERDLRALRTIAEWIKTFVTRPNKDLSRARPVCVPSGPWPWSARRFGLLMSMSPAEAHHKLPNL
jgi:hypothetical protein